MGLPKLKTPIYETTLPLKGKKVKYRPFLSKEEKLLMMAKEGNELESIIQTVNELVKACTFDNVTAGGLGATDLEWMFLKLREKSVGEVIELQKKCIREVEKEDGEKGECGGIVKFNVDLSKIEPPEVDKEANVIALDDKINVIMKWPSIDLLNIGEERAKLDREVMKELIEFITEGTTVYDPKDQTEEEMDEFIDSLNMKQRKKIKEFIQNMPTISIELQYKCPGCGAEDSHTFKGLQAFFG